VVVAEVMEAAAMEAVVVVKEAEEVVVMAERAEEVVAAVRRAKVRSSRYLPTSYIVDYPFDTLLTQYGLISRCLLLTTADIYFL